MAIKILIVEVESVEAKNIKGILESLGYEVPYIAYNGEEVVKMALNSMPDLVLIDLQINGKIDAIDAATKIKELNIPIIYLKAHPSELNIERALRTAPYSYITKPIDRDELHYMIELALIKNGQSKNLKASEEKYRRLVENSRAGEAKTMFGTTQDITDRKLVEKSLKESESKYRNLVETSPDIIWEINKKGVFSYISPQALPILGYKPQELIGRSMFSIISPEAVESTEKSFMSHIERFDKFNTIEVPALRKDGKKLIIEVRSMTMTDINGNIIGLQGISRDITDKTIATKKLKTSIKEKDILLREIHHRVKNNMQIISSLLSLQMTHLDHGDAVDLLKESQNRVRSMAIIHDKLYQSNDFTKIDLSEYIKSLVNGLFYSYSIEDHINSSIDVDDVLLNIETAVPFGLILNELISNSLKHGFPEGISGELYISLKFVDDKYELIVGDTGIGFPEEIDFKKTDSLGLQLVNNLVSQIDGEIELNKSHGTEYKIIFKELKYKERI
jgi:PAS domain S-box-containing protein